MLLDVLPLLPLLSTGQRLLLLDCELVVSPSSVVRGEWRNIYNQVSSSGGGELHLQTAKLPPMNLLVQAI